MAAIHNFGSKLTVENDENDHDGGGGGGDGDGDDNDGDYSDGFHVAILALYFGEIFSVCSIRIFGLKDVVGHRDVYDHE